MIQSPSIKSILTAPTSQLWFMMWQNSIRLTGAVKKFPSSQPGALKSSYSLEIRVTARLPSMLRMRRPGLKITECGTFLCARRTMSARKICSWRWTESMPIQEAQFTHSIASKAWKMSMLVRSTPRNKRSHVCSWRGCRLGLKWSTIRTRSRKTVTTLGLTLMMCWRKISTVSTRSTRSTPKFQKSKTCCKTRWKLLKTWALAKQWNIKKRTVSCQRLELSKNDSEKHGHESRKKINTSIAAYVWQYCWCYWCSISRWNTE